MATEIEKVIKCLKCGSYIHETERCRIWKNWSYCKTSKKFERDCKCVYCASNRCEYCNDTPRPRHFCSRLGIRCDVCNEFMFESNECIWTEDGNFILKPPYCHWDHNKPPCKYCGLHISEYSGMCPNFHDDKSNKLCSECKMPNKYEHKHDGCLCTICGALLNKGKCIYNCVDGGNFCIHCNYEGVYKSICPSCHKHNHTINSGLFTKCAKK